MRWILFLFSAYEIINAKGINNQSGGLVRGPQSANLSTCNSETLGNVAYFIIDR
jgi:hypothetical protein